METSGFETEAYKLMTSDISSAIKTTDNEVFLVTLSGADLLNTQTKKSKKVTLRVSMVWIQGTVTDIKREGIEHVLVVSDGHGEAKILGYGTVPGGEHPDIQIGKSFQIDRIAGMGCIMT